MFNVIFVTDLALWSLGKKSGGPAFTKTVSYYLAQGCKVYLISDVPSNRDYPDIPEKQNRLISPTWFKKWRNLRKIGLLFRWLDHRLMTRRFKEEINNILAGVNNDTVLYAYEVFGVQACSTIAKKKHLPLVSRFQGTILTNYRNTLSNRIKRYPHFQALSEPADLIVMTDDGTQGGRVLKDLGNNSELLFMKNGLDLMDMPVEQLVKSFNRDEFFAQRGMIISPKECVFLTVSRLVPWKRVDRALRGFADYCKTAPVGKLVIVGDGDSRSVLEAEAENFGISDRVFFVGAVPHDEVYDFMMACDVFLSLYDLSNVGNPLLEAMTLGKCIITLDVGDTASVIRDGENGMLLSMEQLPELGKRMSELAQDGSKRNMYGSAAAEFAQKMFCSWGKRMSTEYHMVEQLIRK